MNKKAFDVILKYIMNEDATVPSDDYAKGITNKLDDAGLIRVKGGISTINNIKKIIKKHDNRQCLYCEGELDNQHQCYSCNCYVYDAEYWAEIRKIIGI